MMLLVTLLAALGLVTGCGGAQAESKKAERNEDVPDKLTVGVIPAEDDSEMFRAFEPVREYLSEELGTEVELCTATDYSGIIEAMRSEKVDVVWFGPLSYILPRMWRTPRLSPCS